MNNTFVITSCVFKHLCLNWLAFFFLFNIFAFASKLKLTPVETQLSYYTPWDSLIYRDTKLDFFFFLNAFVLVFEHLYLAGQ